MEDYNRDIEKEIQESVEYIYSLSHDERLEKVQKGELSMVDYVIYDDDLSNQYISDMVNKGEKITDESALSWLLEYEKNNLYK